MYSFEPHRIHGANGFFVATIEWLIFMVYIQTHATFYIHIYIYNLYTHNSSELVPVSFSRDFVPLDFESCSFPPWVHFWAFVSSCGTVGHPSSKGMHEFVRAGRVENDIMKPRTLRKNPLESPNMATVPHGFFLAGNTNLHSGSIFQPSTLVYWRGNGMMLLVSMNYDGVRLENSTHGFSRFFGW